MIPFGFALRQITNGSAPPGPSGGLELGNKVRGFRRRKGGTGFSLVPTVVAIGILGLIILMVIYYA